MHIEDDAEAAQWLGAIGYYRLSGGWYPFRRSGPGHSRMDDFVSGCSFPRSIRLYEFDRHLKSLIHSGIERVEVAMRSLIGHTLGRHDPLAHQDPMQFRPNFAHANWMATPHLRVGRSRGRDQFVDHHDLKYGGQLPI